MLKVGIFTSSVDLSAIERHLAQRSAIGAYT